MSSYACACGSPTSAREDTHSAVLGRLPLYSLSSHPPRVHTAPPSPRYRLRTLLVPPHCPRTRTVLSRGALKTPHETALPAPRLATPHCRLAIGTPRWRCTLSIPPSPRCTRPVHVHNMSGACPLRWLASQRPSARPSERRLARPPLLRRCAAATPRPPPWRGGSRRSAAWLWASSPTTW